MARTTRREFLSQAALAGTAVTVGGLSPLAMAQSQAPVTTSDGAVQMAIARWKGEKLADDKLEPMAVKLTEQAIEALGGMGKFVKKDDVVWIKPNMAWDRKPEFAANTNPDVVATLIRLCYKSGAKKVKVGDFTCHSKELSYPSSGIEAAAKAAGAEVVYLDDSRFKEYPLNGKRLKKWPLYPDIVESDLVINVPVVKHHQIAQVTLCMKNYMGVIGGKRNQWHQDIASCLCDITAFMKPRLCVLDAIRILTANGPTGGELDDVKRMDTVAASTDIVALDAFGAELLGHEPKKFKFLTLAEENKLGVIDYKSLALKELNVT